MGGSDMEHGVISYFAYGSNMHPLRLHKRVPSSEIIECVRLPGYQLHFHKVSHDGSAKCNILYSGDPADQVHGVVYRMRADERCLLDDAEGLGRGYELSYFDIETARHSHQVFCYRADPRYIDDQLRPYDWYRQLVLSAARYHGFPRDYIQRLAEVAAQPDHDRERAGFHFALVDAL
jgi:gamma-glutamylcyclotransferase (GGCT)/AIG2-like uncharacterized protein YtfP